MNEIIGGKLPVRLFLEFLYSHNKTDPLIPKKIKTAVHANGRKWRPVEHGGTIIAYAIMQAGTTSRRRDCHSAPPPCTSIRCFNMDGERASAK